MHPSRTLSQRWLLVADFCAILLAALVSDEVGLVKGLVGRSMLLLAAGVYLVATAVLVYVISVRNPLAKTPATTSPTKSLLGRPGPAFLAYLPRFLMGAALLGYALWLKR